MRQRLKFFRILILSSLAQIFMPYAWAQSLKDFTILPAEGKDKVFAWHLHFHGKFLHELVSIGGRPQIISVEALRSPPGARFFSILYHSGSAGTKTVTYIDRVAILNNVSKKPKIVLDILFELTRDMGAEKKQSYQRQLKWASNGKSLLVSAIDDQPESEFTWRRDTFVARSKPLFSENDDD